MDENVTSKVVMEVDTKPATTSLKDLRNSLKEAKNEMLSAKEGTKEYATALQKASAAQLQMREMNEQIRGSMMDFGEIASNTTKVLGGVVGGIAAVQGTMTLLNIENEKVGESLVKLQSVMAIMSGLSGIDGLIKGMSNLGNMLKATKVGTIVLTAVQKVYNAVLAANPVMLIVIGLVALTGAVIALASAMGKAAERQRIANEEMNKYNTLIEESNHQSELRSKVMEAEGKTTKEILEFKKQQIILEGQLIEAEINRLNNKDKLTKKEKDHLKEIQSEYENNKGKLQNINDQIIIDQVKTNKKIEDEELKHQEKLKEIRSKDISEIKKIEEDIKKSRLDSKNLELYELQNTFSQKMSLYEKYGKDTTNLELWFSEQKSKINEKYLEDIKNQQSTALQEIRNSKLTDQQLELQELNNKYNSYITLFQGNQEQLKMIEDYYQTQKAEINSKYKTEEQLKEEEELAKALELKSAANEQYEIDRTTELERLNQKYLEDYMLLEKYNQSTLELTANYEKQKSDLEKQYFDQKVQLISQQMNDGLQGASNLLSAFQSLNEAKMNEELANAEGNEEKQEQIRKDAFEKNKKLQIVNATISGIQGIINALTAQSVIPDPFGTILKVANAAAVGISTAASIKNIKSQRYQGNSVSPGPTTPNIPRGSVPTVNAPNLGGNITAVRNVSTTEEKDLQKNNKVFVTETDITEKQNKVKVIEKETSF